MKQEEMKECVVEENSKEVIEISILTLVGSNRSTTIRLPGRIKGIIVSILIDSRSIHSFIDELLAQSIQCKMEKIKPTSITVAGGDKLISRAICNSST